MGFVLNAGSAFKTTNKVNRVKNSRKTYIFENVLYDIDVLL